MKLGSYIKAWNLGHPNVEGIFDGSVRIEEKVDGSQFSFGVIDGELQCRSKKVMMEVDAPNSLFAPAVATAKQLHSQGLLPEGWIYRAEAFRAPKHNTLAYSRRPRGWLILFDIMVGPEKYLTREELEEEAARLDQEVVPCFHQGKVEDFEQFKSYLDYESILGGQKIEGVVIKSNQFMDDGKPMYAKFVSEAFKETNKVDFRQRNPTQGDIIENLKMKYRSQSRWDKAVQHLADAEELEHSPRDIGKLIKEVQRDVYEECQDEIKEALFKWAWDKVSRGLIAGLPQYYKDKLAEQAFTENG